jgi:hypothetical protein
LLFVDDDDKMSVVHKDLVLLVSPAGLAWTSHLDAARFEDEDSSCNRPLGQRFPSAEVPRGGGRSIVQ